MTQYHLHRGALLGAALLLASPSLASGEPGIAPRHQAAVRAARAGDFPAALAQMRALRAQAPDDPRLLHDEAAILLWSGDPVSALDRIGPAAPDSLPTYLLEPLAPAARDARQPERAAGYYAALLHREPMAPTPYLAAAMVEAERGYPQAALVRLDAVSRRWEDNADYWMALGYVRGLAGDPTGGVAAYQRALHLTPDNTDARRGVIVQLRHAGRAETALQLAERWQMPLDAQLRGALEHDVLVGYMRRGTDPALSPARQQTARQKALAALGAGAPGVLPALDLRTPLGQRQAFDLVTALRDARRAADVVTLHTQIEAAGIEPPLYALAAAADAHLMLRQPREAETLYRRINQRDPANHQARLGLFYALIEQERFGEALAAVDAAATDARRKAAGEFAPPSAGPLTPTLVTAAMGRAYADDLPGAQRRLQDLPDAGNPGVTAARGTIYRWRGWPRQALASYDTALAAAPQALDPALGRVGALLDLDRTADAQAALDALAANAGDHPALNAARRDIALRSRPQLTVDAAHSRSSGGTFGSRGWGVRSTGYGSLITPYLRPLLSVAYDQARFREGTGVLRRAGVGLDYRRDGTRARLDLTDGHGDNQRAGLGLQLGRWLSDHVWLGSTAEYNSPDVPLRGQNAGVRGNRLQLASRYRFDERRRVGISYDLGEFNDGNTRQSVGGFAEQRLLTKPAFHMDARADLYGSRNTERNTIYYNPERDFAGSVTLDNRWRNWRRYENSFEQHLAVTAGTYKQRGFSSGGTWNVEYGHSWRLGPGLSLGYGVSHGRRIYDGDRERETRFMLTLDARL